MLRTILRPALWIALLTGFVAMPTSVIISGEDGPMPANVIWRKQVLARRVLYSGGGIAAVAAVGLTLIGAGGRNPRS